MRVLIIGGGAREHALADSFAKHTVSTEITVSPGNPGMAREFNCVDLHSREEILAWCKSERPGIVLIGPEQPLADGLADCLRSNQINCIGPSQASARIETSKIFAKELMRKYHIPTASSVAFHSEEEAIQYIKANPLFPMVIKADGLSAGKGVTIVSTEREALAAVYKAFSPRNTGILIEEYLQGWEVSLFAISDGVDFQSTLFSQDHKQLNDDDKGPNTGGMGAYCPVPEAEPYRKQIETEIIAPIIAALAEEGCPFAGFLYCGLMITAQGPKVVEFNCRLGDPETQALLPLLENDLADICLAIAEHRVKDLKLQWSKQSSICVVLASHGYPDSFKTDYPITIKGPVDSRIYYSGVAKQNGDLVTNGGRVMSLVAVCNDIGNCRKQVYQDITKVDFIGKTYRSDIALRKNTL